MKFFLKTILKYYLKYLTKLALFINRPTIIAIAGSTNKTFVKNEINQILKREGLQIRSNPKNFNTEIGLPLAILNLPSGYNSYLGWLPVIIGAPKAVLGLKFPKILVLELGISDPGDMKYLLSIIKPKIAIITDITQRYLESFSDMDNLVGEYELLAKRVKKNGAVILNYDNPRIKKIAKKIKAKIIFFSCRNKDGAGDNFWQIVEAKKQTNGQALKIRHGGKIYEQKINRFGQHHLYSALIGLIIKNELKPVIRPYV